MPEECTICACTDDDCTNCYMKTGEPCHWAAPGICSACAAETEAPGYKLSQGGILIPSTLQR